MLSIFRGIVGTTVSLNTATMPNPPEGFNLAADGSGYVPLNKVDRQVLEDWEGVSFRDNELPSGYRIPNDASYLVMNGILVKKDI